MTIDEHPARSGACHSGLTLALAAVLTSGLALRTFDSDIYGAGNRADAWVGSRMARYVRAAWSDAQTIPASHKCCKLFSALHAFAQTRPKRTIVIA